MVTALFIQCPHIPQRLTGRVQFREMNFFVGLSFKGKAFCVDPCDNKFSLPGIYDVVKTRREDTPPHKAYKSKEYGDVKHVVGRR